MRYKAARTINPRQNFRPLPPNNRGFAPQGPMTMGGGGYQANIQAPFQPQTGGPQAPFDQGQMTPLPNPGFQAPYDTQNNVLQNAGAPFDTQYNAEQNVGAPFDNRGLAPYPEAQMAPSARGRYQEQMNVRGGGSQGAPMPDFRNLSRAQMMQQYQQMTGQAMDPNVSKGRALHQIRMANRNMAPGASRGILTPPPAATMPGKLIAR